MNKPNDRGYFMRIAFVVNSFPSLSQTFILNQITGLLDLGHKVDIFAHRNPREDKIHQDVIKYNLMEKTRYIANMPRRKLKRVLKAFGWIITNFHKRPKTILKSLNVYKYGRDVLSLKILYSVLSFLESPKYDIIHCCFGANGNFGVLLRDLGVIKGKIVTQFYGYDLSSYIEKYGRDIYNPLFQKGDLFLPICDYFKGKLITLGCPENKIVVHRLGVDLSRFSFLPRVKDKSGTIKILTVARLIEKKGIRYSIRAVVKLAEKFSSIEYKIAGDGPLRLEMEGLINKLGAEENIELLGWRQQNEIVALMENSNIFILSSVVSQTGEQEGTPTVLIEAQARGLPVLSTQHSGIPEVVVDGKSGFLVPERDVDALVDRLSYLIEHPELWPEMGRAGRDFVEKYYDIDKLNRHLVEIYEALLKER